MKVNCYRTIFGLVIQCHVSKIPFDEILKLFFLELRKIEGTEVPERNRHKHKYRIGLIIYIHTKLYLYFTHEDWLLYNC